MYGLKRTALHLKVFLILHTSMLLQDGEQRWPPCIIIRTQTTPLTVFQKNSAKIQNQCAKN